MSRKPQIRHLERRPSGFFFRRRVPLPVLSSQDSEKKFLVLSLRTHLPRDAEPLARRLTMLTDLGFAWMAEKKMSHVTPEGMRILTELARFEIAAHEAARAMAPARSRVEADFAFQREQALQQTLREALACGNREIARAPIRDVAQRLGVPLDENSPSYAALAYEATRVLLDLSQDRAQREIGQTGEQTVYFRSARRLADETFATPLPMPMATAGATEVARVTTPMPTGCEPAPLVATAPVTTAMPPHAGAVQGMPVPPAPVAPQVAAPPADMRDHDATRPAEAIDQAQEEVADLRTLEDQKRAEKREKALKNIIISALSPAAQAAIAKGSSITLSEAFDLYLELKGLGYGENFDQKQVANRDVGRKWANTSLKAGETAKQIWVDLLEDRPVQDYLEEEIEDALNVMWDIPAHHGRSEYFSAKHGYRDLIERAGELEIKTEKEAIEELRKCGNPTEAEIEQATIDARIERLSVTTYLRHGRYPNRVAKMLEALKIIDENPFTSVCKWSNTAEKSLRSTRASRARQVWDDKIVALYNSAVFQGDCDEPGEPLFWAPLIARLMGMREEEILQLSPEDFGVQEGIDYLSIHDQGMNRVKSEAAIRKIPIHPDLINLGLLDLVALRRAQGQPRLFPHLPRGETKGTFTEVFTKRFGYYRKTNACYWPGRDFHSFRTTVNGDLMNTDCPDSIRRRIIGHEPLDEGEKSYAQGLKMSTLLRNICKIEVDTSMIKSPFDKGSNAAETPNNPAGLRLVSNYG